MNKLLITVGNIYLDHNLLGVDTKDEPMLRSGKDYFADSGEVVPGGSAVNVALQAKKLGLGFQGQFLEFKFICRSSVIGKYLD